MRERSLERGDRVRIALCDDRREDAYGLRVLLEGHRVRVFFSGPELWNDLTQNNGRYDLYLLDIYMGDAMNGIELAKRIRQRDEDAAICFISTSDAFYREAYDLQDVNYLLKPVDADKLRRLVERTARRHARNRRQSFSYKWTGGTETIPYGNILYFSSSGHALEIRCKDGALHSFKAKLDDVESLVDGSIFLRCHQSFLVNLYQVDHLSGTDLILGAHRVPISRRYFAEVRRRYHEILFEEVN